MVMKQCGLAAAFVCSPCVSCVGVKALTLYVWGHPAAQTAALIALKRNPCEDIIN